MSILVVIPQGSFQEAFTILLVMMAHQTRVKFRVECLVTLSPPTEGEGLPRTVSLRATRLHQSPRLEYDTERFRDDSTRSYQLYASILFLVSEGQPCQLQIGKSGAPPKPSRHPALRYSFAEPTVSRAHATQKASCVEI